MLKTLKTTVVSLTITTLVLFSSSVVAGKFDDVTLRVATWGGLWKGNIEENIVPKFEAEGGKVEFITGSPAANFAKIIAARGEAPFDVVEILAAQVKDYHELDVLHELDLQLIPNTKFLASNRIQRVGGRFVGDSGSHLLPQRQICRRRNSCTYYLSRPGTSQNFQQTSFSRH